MFMQTGLGIMQPTVPADPATGLVLSHRRNTHLLRLFHDCGLQNVHEPLRCETCDQTSRRRVSLLQLEAHLSRTELIDHDWQVLTTVGLNEDVSGEDE